MTLGALHRGLFALRVFRLVAVDADAGGSGRIVERRLGFGLHWGRGGGGVAVLALLVRGRQRLFRLRCVMAGFALAGRRDVSLVIEFHAAHRRTFEDHGAGSSFRSVCAHRDDYQQPKQHDKNTDDVFHSASKE